MADFRLGRLKFKWQGAWATGTAYVIDDIVKYGGNTYVCTTNHTSAANENLFYSSDAAKWSIHVEGIDNKGAWTASTWYKVNDVFKYGNTQYRVTAGFTSAATFASTNTTIYLEGLKYEDSWVASTMYQTGDVVNYGGYSYSAKTNHSSTDTPNADTTNWAVLTVGFSAQGAWASGTTYKPGDVVRYGGNSYVMTVTAAAGTAPTVSANWSLLSEGFNWTGNWASATTYKIGDVVNRTSNSYICILAHSNQAPENDTGGVYWNYIAQGGSAAQVLTTTGDMLYQSAGTIARLGLPAGATGTAAEQAQASGQVLTVGGSPLLPRWETNNTSAPVYYVTKEGADTNSGKQISRGFGSIRYATDYISALTGAAKPSATNPITLYVKAGVYEESLPIHVPAYVSVIGDNLRTTIIKAKTGDSDQLDLTLGANLTQIKLGEVVTNLAGTKTAKVLTSNRTNKVSILPLTGGSWTTSDHYVDITDNKHADGSDLLTSNKAFIASEAYHRHVANVGAVSGVEGTVKTRLEELVAAIAYNVKHGANNKVFAYANALIGGTAITGNNTQDTALTNYIVTIGTDVLRNVTTSTSAGNSLFQTSYTGTADTANPKCPTVVSTLTTLGGIVTTAISNSNMSGTTETNSGKAVTAVGTVTNAHSSMMILGDHTIVRDLVMEGMTGFAAGGGDDQDIEAATVKGVYFRLDPASPITKSPYVQNCSAIGGAAVGALIDGDAHAHFDGSATPSFKSFCSDAFTQVLEGGVGFWCRNTAALEVVSSFTYYAHISYTSTGGGRIRAVSGNSSYGKYGCISRGFDANEATLNGTVNGLRLEVNPSGTNNGTAFANLERIQGGTSGAIGQIISNQLASTNYIFYFPIKGTFADGELITGIGNPAPNAVTASGATHTTKASGAVSGQKGFLLTLEGLSAAPDQGGSVEMIDNGSNNDAGSFVISSSSYAANDGRGSLTVTRAALASTAATGNGTDVVAYFPDAGQSPTLTNTINTSDTDVDVSAITGMVQNGFLVIGNELMKISGFVDTDTVTVTRAQEGTTAASHTSGAAIQVLGTKVASKDEVIEDFNSSQTFIRVAQAGISFKANDYIKIGSEIMKLSAAAADTTGITIINLADEKSVACGDGQSFKIRYRYSQVRLTAHDFLDVGTGNRSNTNWPYLPLSPNIAANEIKEQRPGRVYYVSTDQDGNFSVGNYFKIEQATGKSTLNANSFNLSGLDELQLGAVGAQLGAMINEFSIDGTLAQNSDEKVPTQKAVKTYVDAQIGGGNASTTLNLVGGTGTGSVATGSQSLTIGGTANEIETSASNQTLTVGLPNDVTIGNDLTVTTDLVVGGNLTVNGTTATVNTTNSTITDGLIELANGTTGNATNDTGIVIERGNDNNVFFGFDESENKFVVQYTTDTGSTAGNLTFTGSVPLDLGNVEVSRITTNEVVEKYKTMSTALNTTHAIDLVDKALRLYTSDTSQNWTFNLRGNAGTSLDTMLTTGEALTTAFMIPHGGTVHVMGGLQIDGVNVFSSIQWAGGAAPVAGDGQANGYSVYTFTIFKTGSAAWKIFGSFNAFWD